MNILLFVCFFKEVKLIHSKIIGPPPNNTSPIDEIVDSSAKGQMKCRSFRVSLCLNILPLVLLYVMYTALATETPESPDDEEDDGV